MKNTILFITLFAGRLLFGQCPSTVMDIDSNLYNVVQIGNQCWMKDNLKTTRYSNGDTIEHVADSMTWNALQSGAWCTYDNDIVNDSVYGKLYNWWAVMNGATPTNAVPSNIQGICPSGWHVPSESEWDTLINRLGGGTVAGGKIKDTILWDSPNTGADNSSGFSALPGGVRGSMGKYLYLGKYGYWWTTREFDLTNAYINRAYYNNSNSNNSFVLKMAGYSVRCVKEVGTSTGYKDLDDFNIQIFPNPLKNVTTIDVGVNNIEPYDLLLYDISGKVIRSYYNLKKRHFTLRRENIIKGLYFIKIQCRDRSYIEKLLIK